MAAKGAPRSTRHTAPSPSRPMTAPTDICELIVGAVRGREKGTTVHQAHRAKPFAANDRSYG